MFTKITIVTLVLVLVLILSRIISAVMLYPLNSLIQTKKGVSRTIKATASKVVTATKTKVIPNIFIKKYQKIRNQLIVSFYLSVIKTRC